MIKAKRIKLYAATNYLINLQIEIYSYLEES